jgi:AcrR family transcriptional regulator
MNEPALQQGRESNNTAASRPRRRRSRSDGIRNRDSLLEAAEVLMRERGYDVPLEVIAQAAGVSRTTLARHFPDRETLGLELFERNMRGLEDQAEALREEPHGFRSMLSILSVQAAENLGLAEAIARRREHMPRLMAMRDRLVVALKPLFQAAASRGEITSGVEPEDVPAILDLLMSARGGESERKETTGRVRGIVFAGIFK